MPPKECVQETTDSKISLRDKGSVSAVFLNPDRAIHRKIEMDGCVFKNETTCDWILEKPGVGRIVVELKGCDVGHALKQVESGLNYLKANKMIDLKRAALVVCTKSYPSITTTIQIAKGKCIKNHKAHLHIKKDGRDLVFESLLNSAS